MSRIPVPSHTASYTRSGASERSNSPLPFPERATSPTSPTHPRFTRQSTATMSTLSGSPADTRKKQSRRDEVRVRLRHLPPVLSLVRVRTPRRGRFENCHTYT